MAHHLDLGQRGEEIACQYLTEKGYQIVERNYRYKHLEIDIICLKDEYLVIVEVKTRTTIKFGEPEQISLKKQLQIIKAANYFIQEKNFDNEIRLDIIGIILNQKEQKVTHLEGAFQP